MVTDSERGREKSRRKKRRSHDGEKSKRRRRSYTESESDNSQEPRFSEEQLKEYLAKKAQKKSLKVAKKLKQQAVSGYTNDSNPFGDSNLTEKFVWRKKIEKDVKEGMLDPREITVKAERARLKSRMVEVEKVKKRREERALEKAQHEEEMAMLARVRAQAEFQDWEKKEEEFQFDQSKVRAEIRLREGRAKPIDVLAKNLNLTEDFDVEINEPYKIFKGLTVKEMEELGVDIKMHRDLDKATPMHTEFWTALLVVCEHEIEEATRRDILDRARVRGEEPPPDVVAVEAGLHSSVEVEVQAMLGGKSWTALCDLEHQIEERMRSGTAKVVEYWETVLKRLKIYKAKAKLREIHEDLLRRHLAALQASPPVPEVDDNGSHEEAREQPGWDDEVEEEQGNGDDEHGSFSPQLLSADEVAKEADVPAGAEAGSFSPDLIHGMDSDDVVDPEADRTELEQKRAQVVEEQQRRLQEAAALASRSSEGLLTAAEKAAALKVMGVDEGDAVLGAGAEVSLESQVYWWHDKYRPRKPKYFNRVHTGYEWNKYNQTHYDHDNPPPKIVQGYKFNIFYPDLIDKIKAPIFTIERDGSKDGETCLIRFHAGPPYEDIAFRIVNKEWEYSHKKGFKCTFERGILHVYFNFKRYRYRR